MILYTAGWILPVAGRPIADGAIAVDDNGVVVAVGPRAEVVADHGEAEARDLGRVAVLPGLVNAHTHLELAWLAADPPPAGDWCAWVEALLDRRREEDSAELLAAAEQAVAAMARRGVVAVGDIGNTGLAIPAIAGAGLRGVAFIELYGLRPEGAEAALADAAERLDRLAADPDIAAALTGGRLHLALTAHAPHTTGAALLRALAGRSAATGDPLSIHVAESAAEVRWLADGGGPLAELFARREFAPANLPAPGMSPIEWLDRVGALGPRTLVVHAVHVGPRDISRLQVQRSTVVTCPRSNATLGVGVAPVPRLMREGVPVALGTDSPASAPDFDMFAEMKALRTTHPELTPAAVLRMATLNGATALGLGDRLGTIAPGRLAALAVVPMAATQDDPLAAVCDAPAEAASLAEAQWTSPS